jgi:LEA14-like dessication related protein
MLHKRAYLPILLLSVFLLPSCKDFDKIEFTGVDKFVLKGMENNKVTFMAGIGVRNPSSVSFKVSAINLKTIVDGNYIGTLTADNMVRIPARSDSSYRMDFSLELASSLTALSNLYNLSQKKQVTIEMQGYVKARSHLVGRKVEVKEKQLIDVPSMNR